MITSSSVHERFRHDALLYANEAEFMAGTVPFLRDAIRNQEPALVVESRDRIEQLRSVLGNDAAQVEFANMGDVGANPARIIPAWQEFVDRHPDAPTLRGIGEPIWAGRTPDELVECQRHEALLNTAFASGRPWWLLCPYNVESLPREVIAEARRSHEFVASADEVAISEDFDPDDLSSSPGGLPFSPPRSLLGSYAFDHSSLASSRRELFGLVTRSGLSKSSAAEFVAAVHEIASNSVQHGGGRGTAEVWVDGESAVCEIRDAGHIEDPLADRRRPGSESSASRGFWLANQLCDLVQVRSGPGGTAVRLRKRLDDVRQPFTIVGAAAN